MPLVPVPNAAEYRSSEVRFAMVDPDDPDHGPHVVTITLGALDGLGSPDLTGREKVAWVEAHRAQFEQIASTKYDSGLSLMITVADWMMRFPLPA